MPINTYLRGTLAVAGTEAELPETAVTLPDAALPGCDELSERPESRSRLSRFKSAPSSAAVWERITGSFSNALLIRLPAWAAIRDSSAVPTAAPDSELSQ